MVSKESLDVRSVFMEGRTYSTWRQDKVDDTLLRDIYGMARMGPTSMNVCPLRVLFVREKEDKEKLVPCLSPGNVEKTRHAPVTAIFAYDMAFYERMDVLAPHVSYEDMVARHRKDKERTEKTASFNAHLQAAYMMIAARGMGLDCGPMGGFVAQRVDEAFFQESPRASWRSFLLCNMGHGEAQGLRARAYRLSFDEACAIL